MKITHWAIIFLVIIIPFSIIARTTIQNKILVLQDQTRIDNVLDNATYDAVGQIIEVSEALGYGKNIPITKGVAMAAVNRFFQSLAVNFNLPSNTEISKDYFGQFIPAIIIVGYDGLYVYSYDKTSEGYKYVMKPKVPYTYTAENGAMISFTLGNDLRIYYPSDDFLLEGYIGELDEEWTETFDNTVSSIEVGQRPNFVINDLPLMTTNITYIIKKLDSVSTTNSYLFSEFDITSSDMAQDYEYNEDGSVKTIASDFHLLRRRTIIDLIIATLQHEVNEHETFADLIGVSYDFNIPDIDRTEWNNTVDDISVLAFFQGMPIGTTSYYNNYSLGGARIVQAKMIYGTSDELYHRFNCPNLPHDSDGNLDEANDFITDIFINASDAHKSGYWACPVCR